MANPRLSFLSLVPFGMRRANVYFIAVVAICCTLFYLVGIWQHSGSGSASVTGGLLPHSIVSRIPCNLSHSSADAAIGKPVSFDFYPKHTADHLLPPATGEASARVPRFPPCDARLSEYTPCEDVERSLKFERERSVGH